MAKATLSRIMRRGHEIARQLEGNYQARLSYSLKVAWAEYKKGGAKVGTIEISYHTTYGFSLGEYGKTTKGQEMQNVLVQNDVALPTKVAKEVAKALEKNKFKADRGDYTMTTYYRLTAAEFEAIVKKTQDAANKKSSTEKNQIAELQKKAQETGKRQLHRQWMVPCAQCDADWVYEYVTPEGKIERERYHAF